MTREPAGYRVALYDAEPNAVARALAGVLEQHLAVSPGGARTARRIPRPVVLYATDTDTTATLACEQDRATVYNDLAGRPSIIVRADTDSLGDLWRLTSTARTRVGEEADPRRGPAAGSERTARRYVVGQIAARRIRVTGLLRHPLTAARFLSLLAAVE